MSQVKYEAVLIWSHEPASGIGEGRQFKAYNRVFEAEPTREDLAVMVAQKQTDIEQYMWANPDPAMHRLEVRRVETTQADLEGIVAEYNAGQDGE